MNSIPLSENPGKKIATGNTSKNLVVMILVFALLVFGFVLIALTFFTNNLWNAYHDDDRITYVMLDPNGNWTIERTDRQKDDYYERTVKANITRLIQKCLSNVPATIQNDWAVCASFLSDDKLKEFFNNKFIPEGMKFNEYVEEHIQCPSCDYIKFKVKDVDHKNSVPTSFKDVYGKDIQIFESLIYGTFTSSNGDKKNAVVDLKWSFVSRKAKSKFNDLLVENPLGIYFVDYFEVEDQ